MVDYRHIIHALRRKPMALLNLVYREQLFPRDAFRHAWDALIATQPARNACRTMVGLLALAHDRACEAELASELEAIPDAGELPDLTELQRRFMPSSMTVPDVTVTLPAAIAYDALLSAPQEWAAVMSAIEVDTTRLPLLLHDLRLPAIARLWPEFTERADKEGWPAARFLSALAELEIAERGRRRTERQPCRGTAAHRARRSTTSTSPSCRCSARRASWRSPPATPGSTRRPTCCCSDRPAPARATALRPSAAHWSRMAIACCSPAPRISCRRLQAARQALQLEAAIAKLDKYHLLILDDLSYVHKDHAETSVLFELIGARYERRSMLITANQPFADWNKVFPDHAMMIAAIDRLVHHSIIFEMNVESYRRRGALDRKRPGTRHRSSKAKETTLMPDCRAQRQSSATIKNTE